MFSLSNFWNNLQQHLFPMVEKCVGTLTEEHKHLISILELIRIEDKIPSTRFNFGRPSLHKTFIARAFVAKIFLKLPYTKQLVKELKQDPQLRTICGWEFKNQVPSEATFSRAFKEFANSPLLAIVHDLLISKVYNGQILQHITKDSTPILAREKHLKKVGSPKERKKLANQRYLNEKKGIEISRRQKQLKEVNLAKMIEDLPNKCDFGAKVSAQGKLTTWKGYKLHVAISDDCIPISVLLTSASLNDCEAAIPLANKANKVAKNFYDLMDSAYDVPEIKEHSVSLEHVPIIDSNPRCKEKKEEKLMEKKRKKILNFKTAEDIRYSKRFQTERFNAQFKDYYGGRNIFYKGHSKILCHIMFGVLTLTASIALNFP